MRVSAARPELIRMLNERLVLDHIRTNGPSSRAELARASGLSKSTVSMAMANVERAGLVREAGHRRGAPGRAAQLYEVTPDAGFVLALDVGRQFLRGALANLTGSIVARETVRSRAIQGRRRVSELIGLADILTARAGISRAALTQTVVGCPGVYDRHADTIRLTGGLTGWDQPGIPAWLRDAFGESLMVENDVDAAALAEQAHGHGRHAGSFAFVTVGTGIGMGLVLESRTSADTVFDVDGVAGVIKNAGVLLLLMDERREPFGKSFLRRAFKPRLGLLVFVEQPMFCAKLATCLAPAGVAFEK